MSVQRTSPYVIRRTVGRVIKIMAINEPIDMGIPLNSSASSSIASIDMIIWLFSGAIVGAMIQRERLVVAFRIGGLSPFVFACKIVLTSFVAGILGMYLLQLVNTIFQYKILSDYDGEVEYISEEMKTAFLLGSVVSDNNVEKN